MSRISIKQLKNGEMQGQELIEKYALRKVEIKTKESDGKSFLSLEVGDATGRVDAVLWNEADAAYKQVSPGDVVQVKAVVGRYKDNVQLRIENIRKCERSEYDLAEILASSAFTRSELEASLRSELAGVKNPSLAKLLKLFFDDQDFMRDFLDAPAAKLWHHGWIGGLAEHTVAVCRLARGGLKNYQLLDPDLLITGCLLHDIGKIREFTVSTFVDYSDDGRLMGHIVLGDQMLLERMAKIKDFPRELAKRLRHILLSHHGEKEKGSPVVPATLEALVVHHCDLMDAHAAAYERIIRREGVNSKRWSEYVNLIDRFIYLAREEGVAENPQLF
ncbi:MAG: OB-fold nucleic acid binding domain-containing protein [Candidatus Edwardsbacteria bacterium]|nr:OB-fold nucleic acid binding domain-containing protein [Candidatus Edwardsbacteria bacterium]